MIRIRPYKSSDASKILSWCQDEKSFYMWSAGILGSFPVTEKEFRFVESLMPFTAVDDEEIVGFFTFRHPGESMEELRFGFIIVDPAKRGRGYGKKMLQLGLEYAFETGGAKKVSLGVFENNLPAYYCYKSAGFQDVILDETEKYFVLGEEWKCRELAIVNDEIYYEN
ncbi:MAG: GNAT family N-acetyltransferase [Lachnospiraceae bacterium]|nr:GNAT family N-acetyltransferase [Lachnospiraceae bacterium]